MKHVLHCSFLSCIPSLFVYLLVNTAAEKLCFILTGISIEKVFENNAKVLFGTAFHSINLLLFSGEMFLVMVFYGLIKNRFASKRMPVVLTSIFFIIFIGLFTGQMVNLRIYPVSTALIFMITTIIAFPVSVATGSYIYGTVQLPKKKETI